MEACHPACAAWTGHSPQDSEEGPKPSLSRGGWREGSILSLLFQMLHKPYENNFFTFVKKFHLKYFSVFWTVSPYFSEVSQRNNTRVLIDKWQRSLLSYFNAFASREQEVKEKHRIWQLYSQSPGVSVSLAQVFWKVLQSNFEPQLLITYSGEVMSTLPSCCKKWKSH